MMYTSEDDASSAMRSVALRIVRRARGANASTPFHLKLEVASVKTRACKDLILYLNTFGLLEDSRRPANGPYRAAQSSWLRTARDAGRCRSHRFI
eukprot:scaffold12976_cov197-Amphora_coffeaeformis.AAC.5